MASYLPQPDGSNACCDCDRSGPCDDYGPTSTGCCGVNSLDGFVNPSNQYLTLTVAVTQTVDECDPSCLGGTTEYTVTTTGLNDPGCCCSVCVSATGSSSYAACAGSPACSSSLDCLPLPRICNHPARQGCWGWSGDNGASPCIPIGDDLLGATVVSDTVSTISRPCNDFANGDCSCHIEVTFTLSHPCTNPGGEPDPTYLCCPYDDICCPAPATGACCAESGGDCEDDFTAAACASVGGTWYEGQMCADCPSELCCPTLGACCGEAVGGCLDGISNHVCDLFGGTWYGSAACSDCNPGCC